MLRRTAPALLALLVLGASACGDAATPAIRVGDLEVSEDEFLDELEEWAGNEFVASQIDVSGDAPGSYSAELVSTVAQDRIQRLLVNHIADDLDVEVTAGDVDAAREVIGAELLDGFSDEYAEGFLDDVARSVVAQEELGDDEIVARFQALLEESDIEVSSRFGSWDSATQRVLPPQGPAAADG